MAGSKTDIWVYAHWAGMMQAKCIGVLSVHQAKGRKAFSFEYDDNWITTKEQRLLDPDIGWYSGPQFPNGKENFGIFLDSMPDTWGRTLMKRRAILKAKEENKPSPTLYDIDFLLGVYDGSRMGALRFKLDKDGPFLDNNNDFPAPPWYSVRELQHGVEILESGTRHDNELKKWLAILMAPGSSLGGARPKANILDDDGHPWIAKFPSKTDILNIGAWEYLAYLLGKDAGIEMSPSKFERIAGNHYTFFTKRFDRLKKERIHFASAMTMTGNSEDTVRDKPASYLDLADFILNHGTNVDAQLSQLWRRIVFNIAISNTDDHLRNHGFILTNDGWILSPAYDINPSTDKDGLALNIDMENNALEFDLAKSVGVYFRLDSDQMDTIITEVKTAVKSWQLIATKIGISRSEQDIMSPAFNYEG